MEKPKEETPAEFVKITGKCRQCGKCCIDTQIEVSFPNSIKYTDELLMLDLNKIIEEVIGTHLKKNPYWDLSKVNEINIQHNFIQLKGARCRALKKKGKKYFCSIYDKRPRLCKNYPGNNSIMLEGCGFKKRKMCQRK